MKKSILTLMVVMAFAISVFGAETNGEKNVFVGFEGVELTLQEAGRITGGETYVFYDHVAFGQYHTGLVTTDKPITEPGYKVDGIIEYEPEHGVSTGRSSALGFGNNTPQNYEKKRTEKVADNLKKYSPQQVPVPEGKTVKEFDNDIQEAAKKYEEKKYSISENSCNTATSTIIKYAGSSVTPKKSVPGWKK